MAHWITSKHRTLRKRAAVAEPKDEAKWNFDFKNEVPVAVTPSATSHRAAWKQATSEDTTEVNKSQHLYNDKQHAMKQELLQNTGAY